MCLGDLDGGGAHDPLACRLHDPPLHRRSGGPAEDQEVAQKQGAHNDEEEEVRMSTEPTFRAWGDESGSVAHVDKGVYLMAAVIAAPTDAPELVEAMRALALPGERKVHWRGDTEARHDEVVDVISGLPIEAIVVVRQGPEDERDERRRRKCFELFVPQIDELGCVELVLESRGVKADKRDRDMLDAMRARHAVGGLRLNHSPGPADPVLWIADAVCGAVVAHRTARPQWLQHLERKITLHHVDSR